MLELFSKPFKKQPVNLRMFENNYSKKFVFVS